MQVRLTLTALLCSLSFLLTAASTPTIDTSRLSFGNQKLVQLGIRYRHAVRLELEVPTAELLIQPFQYVSAGFRFGSVRTKKLPELFAGSRGQMRGFVCRINLPLEDKLDVYAEYAKMRGNLPFSATVFGLERSTINPRLRPSTALAGEVAFRQNQFQLGIRQHLGRYFFVDCSVGAVFEEFLFAAQDVGNRSGSFGEATPGLALAYLFDWVEELPPNEWHDHLGFRVGISVGVRF